MRAAVESVLGREAHVTMAQIKALNVRRARSRTAMERECLKLLISAARDDWYRRVEPLLNARHTEMQREHRARRERVAAFYQSTGRMPTIEDRV